MWLHNSNKIPHNYIFFLYISRNIQNQVEQWIINSDMNHNLASIYEWKKYLASNPHNRDWQHNSQTQGIGKSKFLLVNLFCNSHHCISQNRTWKRIKVLHILSFTWIWGQNLFIYFQCGKRNKSINKWHWWRL